VRWVRRLTVVVVTALAAAPAAHAATIPVTTTADGVANEGLCSLREAVSAAGVTVIDTLRGDRAFDVFQGSSLALEALTVLRAAQRPAAQAGRSATRARSSSCARASRATPPAMAQTPRAGRCRRGDLERRPGQPVGRDRRRPLPRQRHRDGHPGGRVGPVLVGSASGGNGGAIALDSGTAEISATTFGRNRAQGRQRRRGGADRRRRQPAHRVVDARRQRPRRPGDRRQRGAGRSGQRLDPGDPRLGPRRQRRRDADHAARARQRRVNALVGVPCPGTDQRGLPRRRPLGACDAGAVEVQPSEPGAAGVAQPTPGAATRATPGLVPLLEPVRLPGGPLGRQRRRADQVAPGQGPDRRHRALPPRRRRAGHLHHHHARAGAASAASGRAPPTRAPSAASAPRGSRAASPARAPPARTPSASPAACAARPCRRAATRWSPSCRGRRRQGRPGHQGLPDRAPTARGRVLTSAVARGAPRGLPTP
jgi:CSLREA domain-containing protein